MFGAGFSIDMINRMKQNRDQRKSSGGKFKLNYRGNIYSDKENHINNKSKLSPEKIRMVRLRIKNQHLKERRKEIFVFIFLGILSTTIIVFLINLITSNS